MRSLLPRARAALSALLFATLLGGALVVTAGPAAAAETPRQAETVRQTERDRAFDAFLLTIERIRTRADAKAERAPICRDAGAGEVPNLVADIFRCHLEEAGFAPEEIARVAAEAVAVSHCESLWDADVVVFDGRYLDQAHPATGYRYSAAGVFQFIRKTADKWIEGGYAHVTDARRNIDAAARLYLHNRANGLAGWEDWACAAANDGFKQGSILPGWPGGPAALPDWAHQY